MKTVIAFLVGAVLTGLISHQVCTATRKADEVKFLSAVTLPTAAALIAIQADMTNGNHQLGHKKLEAFTESFSAFQRCGGPSPEMFVADILNTHNE